MPACVRVCVRVRACACVCVRVRACVCVCASRSRVIQVDAQLITEDVLGPPPSPDLVPDLKLALDQLNAMTGLRAVKEATLELTELSRTNYQRELFGREPLLVPLNRLFLGMPPNLVRTR